MYMCKYPKIYTYCIFKSVGYTWAERKVKHIPSPQTCLCCTAQHACGVQIKIVFLSCAVVWAAEYVISFRTVWVVDD